MNYNVSPQFMTYGINLVGMVFSILILFVFLAKGKSHNISSKVFFTLLVVSLLAALFSIFASVNVVKNSPSTNLFCIITLLLINCWNFLLIYYVSICFKTNEQNKEFNLKHPYISYVLGFILFIIIVLASIFLKIELVSLGEGRPYLFSGSFLTFTDITGVLAIVYSVICIILNRDKLDKLTVVLGIYTITSCSFLLGLNMSKIMSFNNTSFMHAFVLFFLYLSIESQDALLINEFKQSVEKSNEYNKLRSEFIMNMSHELIKHLDFQ